MTQREEFEAWADSYGLCCEPLTRASVEYDCFEAYKAGQAAQPDYEAMYKKGFQAFDCPVCGFDGALGFQPVTQPSQAHLEVVARLLRVHEDRTPEDALKLAAAMLEVQPSQAGELSNDPLQGAVDWFLQADGEFFCTATVQRTLRIGYNRAQRLCNIAKERAAINARGDAS